VPFYLCFYDDFPATTGTSFENKEPSIKESVELCFFFKKKKKKKELGALGDLN
jgi:hypothetical protein